MEKKNYNNRMWNLVDNWFGKSKLTVLENKINNLDSLQELKSECNALAKESKILLLYYKYNVFSFTNKEYFT